MDYEDDMYGVEDDTYDDYDSDMNDDDVEDTADEADDDLSDRNQVNYKVLGEAEIRQLQDDDVTRICTVLSISRDSARILLHHYRWSASTVEEEWFADDEKVRKALGLAEKPVVSYSKSNSKSRRIVCGICFDSYRSKAMRAAVCGHRYCSACWGRYVSVSVSDGAECLRLRCPEPSCRAAVGQDMIGLLASKEDGERYSNYLLRSYVENYRKTKWCPAPGCEYAVLFNDDCNGSYDVVCKCSHDFCWNCCEEAHSPVACDIVAKWVVKNSAESENTDWILANSKPCPKCKRPIEKNQGCMHMTCRLCKFEFCWLCLATWKAHNGRTGGNFSCNFYKKAKDEGLYDESEARKQMAKNSLRKYTHYYERWATNNASRAKALVDLEKMKTVYLKTLSDKQCQPETQLEFLLEAWKQIIECRRVLKWTYAYGYYLPDDQSVKKRFFEYAQGEAEAHLERLHGCAEKELQVFLEPKPGVTVNDDSLKPFVDFRTKLTGLTSVTRIYFMNLVRDIQNGLSEVSNKVTISDATVVGSGNELSSNGDDTYYSGSE